MCCGTKDADHDYLTSICVSCFDTASKQRLPQSWNEPCRIHVMYCHAQRHEHFSMVYILFKYSIYVDLNNMSFTWSLVTTTLRRLWRRCTRNPPAARLDLFAARPRPFSRLFWVFEAVHFQRWEGFFWADDHLSWIWVCTWNVALKACCEPLRILKKPNNIVNTTNKIVILVKFNRNHTFNQDQTTTFWQ